MSLGQLSLKYIGPKIWSDIPENMKSFSPLFIWKQHKNVLLYKLAKIPIDICFMLVTFYNIVLMPLFSPRI